MTMTLAAGRFNRRITIQRRADGADAYGQPSTTWETHVQTWADVRAPAGRAAAQDVTADRTTSVAAYSMRIRYRTDITADMRVLLAGMVFDIAQVLPDLARHEHTDLVCVAGRA